MEKNQWNFPQKIALRFFIVFFVLLGFPFTVDTYVPFLSKAFDWYYDFYKVSVPWFGEKILHTNPINPEDYYGGDTLFSYVMMLFLAIIAAIGTIIWSIIDRKPRDYNRLLYWFTVGVRYYLALIIFMYGFGKVIQTQFPYPSLFKLNQTFGTQSPMGLLWSFMGYSKAYNFFTGMAEVAGALLILFRRTKTLGALILVTVMSNVVMLNFCYDVSVKIYASLELLMAGFLVGLDYKRLVSVFFTNKIAQPLAEDIPFAQKNVFIASRFIKYAVIIYVLWFNFKDNYGYVRANNAVQPLRGIYVVESFQKNEMILPPLTTDTLRWKKLIIDFTNQSQIQWMNDSTQRFSLKIDTLAKKLTMTSKKDTLQKSNFTFINLADSTLILRGNWKKDSVLIKMKKIHENKYLLNSRGFNWINETLNR